MPLTTSTFDINKFCNGEKAKCNNVGYHRVVTSTNDPSISKKLRYSQYVRTTRLKSIRIPGATPPPINNERPLYLFATGQIFTRVQ